MAEGRRKTCGSKQLAWRPLPRSSCKLQTDIHANEVFVTGNDICDQAVISSGYLEVAALTDRHLVVISLLKTFQAVYSGFKAERGLIFSGFVMSDFVPPAS